MFVLLLLARGRGKGQWCARRAAHPQPSTTTGWEARAPGEGSTPLSPSNDVRQEEERPPRSSVRDAGICGRGRSVRFSQRWPATVHSAEPAIGAGNGEGEDGEIPAD